MATTYTRKDMVAAAEVGRSRAEDKAALAVRRATARYDKLKEQGDELMAETMRGAAVTGVAYGAGWARGRYGDAKMTVMGLPVEAIVGLGGHVAALAMRSGSGSAMGKQYAPMMHSVANGALAAWLTQEGRETGVQMRVQAANRETATAGYAGHGQVLPGQAVPHTLPAAHPQTVAGATPHADQAVAEAVMVMSQRIHGEEAA